MVFFWLCLWTIYTVLKKERYTEKNVDPKWLFCGTFWKMVPLFEVEPFFHTNLFLVENGNTLQSGTKTVPKWRPCFGHENGSSVEPFWLHFFLSVYAKTRPPDIFHQYPWGMVHTLNTKTLKNIWTCGTISGRWHFHCSKFCFDKLILVNSSRSSSKQCLCLHFHVCLLSIWYRFFHTKRQSLMELQDLSKLQ